MSTSLPYLPGYAARQVVKNPGVLVTGGPLTLFTITGGRVRLLCLSGVVSTVIGAGVTSLAINANPTVGADTPLCAVGVVTSAPVNSLVAITGVVADALTVVLATQGAIRGMGLPLIAVVEGMESGAMLSCAAGDPICRVDAIDAASTSCVIAGVPIAVVEGIDSGATVC